MKPGRSFSGSGSQKSSLSGSPIIVCLHRCRVMLGESSWVNGFFVLLMLILLFAATGT
jgi:hypothetical protein